MAIELGELRRGQIITTFGPGAIIDFRSSSGGPVSVVAAGIDMWDERAGSEGTGTDHPQSIVEPRLQRLLGVKGFRLPPVVLKNDNGRYESGDRLIGVRFPAWLFCPLCHRLRRGNNKWGVLNRFDPARICGSCSEPDRPVYAVPVRFITICEAGHLDEFPWNFWVRHKDSCQRSDDLSLEGTGSGMKGLILSCRECAARTTMDGCFSQNALEHAPCSGKRLWLGDKEDCGEVPRTVYRGASNVHFPVLVSALDIPPWSDDVQKKIPPLDWHRLEKECKTDQDRLDYIRVIRLHERLGFSSPELVLKELKDRFSALDRTSADTIRPDEHRAFLRGTTGKSDREFRVEDRAIAPELEPFLSAAKSATRLREVRAMKCFTRVIPPADWRERQGLKLAAISRKPLGWLPAAEINGEGIFLELDHKALRAWESIPEVAVRAKGLREAFEKDWVQRYGKEEPINLKVTPRYLLVHALSHVLMRQLAIEAGYSSASISERLYVSDDDYEMAGLLLYTATSDADGTMGGLSRQAERDRLMTLVVNGVRSMEWCSNDPLCIQSVQSTSEMTNGAACHACMMAPETSCERFNRLLDRWMLVGDPERRSLGFFSPLLGY